MVSYFWLHEVLVLVVLGFYVQIKHKTLVFFKYLDNVAVIWTITCCTWGILTLSKLKSKGKRVQLFLIFPGFAHIVFKTAYSAILYFNYWKLLSQNSQNCEK